MWEALRCCVGTGSAVDVDGCSCVGVLGLGRCWWGDSIVGVDGFLLSDEEAAGRCAVGAGASDLVERRGGALVA